MMHYWKIYQLVKLGSHNNESDLYKSLQQTLRERTKGTAVFWRFVLGVGLFQQRVHIYSRQR